MQESCQLLIQFSKQKLFFIFVCNTSNYFVFFILCPYNTKNRNVHFFTKNLTIVHFFIQFFKTVHFFIQQGINIFFIIFLSKTENMIYN